MAGDPRCKQGGEWKGDSLEDKINFNLKLILKTIYKKFKKIVSSAALDLLGLSTSGYLPDEEMVAKPKSCEQGGPAVCSIIELTAVRGIVGSKDNFTNWTRQQQLGL